MIFSIFAFLTASKRVPYFACPFFIGTAAMAALFTGVFVTTQSRETSLYYKQHFCNQFVSTGQKR